VEGSNGVGRTSCGSRPRPALERRSGGARITNFSRNLRNGTESVALTWTFAGVTAARTHSLDRADCC
jgi:hypothetical protein